MFSNLKLKIGLSKLRKQAKSVKRHKMVYNLQTARKVGIVFFASNGDEFDHAMNLVSFLTGKNIDVALLAYCPEKEIPQNFYLRKHTKVFTKKELNWYGKPTPEYVNKFISLELDILIDLSMHEIFPLRWVSTLSTAKFKVGALNYFGNPNDLVINVKKEQNIDYLISQIKHYLNLINNRFAQQEDWENEQKLRPGITTN